jgi:hypothetical protein
MQAARRPGPSVAGTAVTRPVRKVRRGYLPDVMPDPSLDTVQGPGHPAPPGPRAGLHHPGAPGGNQARLVRRPHAARRKPHPVRPPPHPGPGLPRRRLEASPYPGRLLGASWAQQPARARSAGTRTALRERVPLPDRASRPQRATSSRREPDSLGARTPGERSERPADARDRRRR